MNADKGIARTSQGKEGSLATTALDVREVAYGRRAKTVCARELLSPWKGHLPGLLWPQVLLPGDRGVKKGLEEVQRWKMEKRILSYCCQGATEVRVGGKSDLRLGSVKRAGLAFLLQLSGGLQEEHHHHPHLQGQP